MIPRHQTLEDMWNEWHGLSDFHDPLGGINGRNKEFGTKWRKHLQPLQYSRTARVIDAIVKYATDNEVPWGNAIEALEPTFQECKGSVANMVLACQAKGLLSKKAPRGKQIKVEV